MENYLILIGAVMCVIMALGVVFDSASWEHDEQRGGLFNFKHRWVSIVCKPMLFIVPALAAVCAVIVPMNAVNTLIEYLFRILTFVGMVAGAAFIFVTVSAIAFLCKGLKHTKNK